MHKSKYHRRANSEVIEQFKLGRYSVKLRLFAEDGSSKPRWKVVLMLTYKNGKKGLEAFIHRRDEDSAREAYSELVNLLAAVSIGAADRHELRRVMELMAQEEWRPNKYGKRQAT
jgi:hypothetical protein